VHAPDCLSRILTTGAKPMIYSALNSIWWAMTTWLFSSMMGQQSTESALTCWETFQLAISTRHKIVTGWTKFAMLRCEISSNISQGDICWMLITHLVKCETSGHPSQSLLCVVVSCCINPLVHPIILLHRGPIHIKTIRIFFVASMQLIINRYRQEKSNSSS